MSDGPLLEVENLTKHFPITKGVLKSEVGRVRAVDGISFTVERGETVGIVGESGCGKSTAARTLLRLEEPTDGSIQFDGTEVTDLSGGDLKRFRRRAQMIFQDPSSSFDPRMSIGDSISEPLRIHGVTDKTTRREVAKDLLERVGLGAEDVDRYPHEFSGGQKQRVALARALVLNPELIVADEPTSALDVSIQSDILRLIDDIQSEFNLGLIFISHDMGVIREVCDRVAVMYLGEIVELGPTEELFDNPQHPYTEALLSSIPTPDPRQRGSGIKLTGDVPSPSNPPSGCRFHTRCHRVIQPEGYDFDQDNWRAVMNFRTQLQQGGIDVEGAREFVATERGPDVEPADVSDEATAAAIREEFDVPEQLTDGGAESVFAEAMDLVTDEDFEAATGLLAEEFETVCETATPEFTDTEADHPAACHLVEGASVENARQSASTDD